MSFSFPIYSSVLLAPSATPTSPVTATLQYPVLSNLTNLSSSTGNLYFNFVITTGTVSSGPNTYVNLRYIFSSNPSYSLSSFPINTLANAATMSVQVPSTLSLVRDFTNSLAVPIEGPYLYTWLDLSNFQNPITLSVSAYSSNEQSISGATAGVTSVGLIAPSIFSVTNSPVTSSGTISLTTNAQNAGTVWAGPTSGSPATPTFRALVSTDFGFNITSNDIIACLGANVTLGTGSTGSNFVNSWPAQLSQNFPNTFVYNYGVAGSTAGPVGTSGTGQYILAASSPSAYQYKAGAYTATTTTALSTLQTTANTAGGTLYVFVDYGINDVSNITLSNFVTYIQSITSTLHGYGSNVKVIYNTPTALATVSPQLLATFGNALKGNVNQGTQTYSANKADYLNDVGSVFTDSSSIYLYSSGGINPNNQGYAVLAQLATNTLRNRPTVPQSLGYIPESLIFSADDLTNAIVLEGSNKRTLVNSSNSVVANFNNTDFQLPYLSTAGVVVNDTTGNLTSSTAPTVSGVNLTALPTTTSLYPTLNQNTTGNAATATTATTATNFSGSLSGDVSGTQSATVVSKINGTSLASLTTGLIKNTTTTGVPTIAVSGTDYAPATSGTSILYGNGSGGFSNATVGTGLSFSGGVLSNTVTVSGTVTSFSAGNLSPLFTTSVATSTTTPALTFNLSTAAQNSVFAGPATGGTGAPSFQTAPTISGVNLTALPTTTSLYPTLNQNTSGTAAGLSSILAIASGGTGTATPSLVAGTNVTISGSWPNQTINSSGGGSTTVSAYSLFGNNTSSSATGTSLSTGIELGTPSVSDTGIGIQQTNTIAGYYQWLLQNTNSGSTSSVDLVLNNNSGTSTTYYVNLGMNSSGFTGSGSLNQPSYGYLTSTSGDLAIGTTTSNAIHFLVNSSTTDALQINTSSQLVVPAFSTAGIIANNSSGVLSSTNSISASYLPTATTSQLGVVKPDGTTITISSGIISAAGGGGTSTSETITQSNTFSVGNVIYYNGSAYALAQANVPSTAEALGIISSATGTQFTIVYSGRITGLSSLTADQIYYLSDTTAGLLQPNEPTTNGTVSRPILVATSTTSGIVLQYRPTLISNSASAVPIAFKNRLINGTFRQNQRAATSITTAAQTAALYFADRWYAYATGAAVTFGVVTNPGSGLQYAAQITGAASNTGVTIGQRIEATNIYDLAGSTVTLSVYASASAITTLTWKAYYSASTDTWTSTPTLITSGTFTINSGFPSTPYSTQITLPSNVTAGLAIEFSVGAMTSGTLTISGAQLEAGSIATTFERIPVSQELSLCQRYYYQIGGVAYSFIQQTYFSSIAAQFTLQFPVQMRAAPTFTLVGTISYVNASALIFPSISAASAAGSWTTTSAGNSLVQNSSGSYLTFSAEL